MKRSRGILLLLAVTLAALFSASVTVVPQADAAASWPTVREGASGPNVRTIQLLLARRGHDIVVDGQFGPQTKTRVTTFQRNNGLVADGIVGPQTWPKLVIEVRPGMSGQHVRAVQVQLNKHGFGLAVDGQYGEQTRNAVIWFKVSRGLPQDGVVGGAAWRELVGTSPGGGVGPNRLPVPRSSTTRAHLGRAHHTYPAIDIMVTNVAAYAARAGTVRYIDTPSCGIGIRLDLGNNNRMNYCHLSSRSVGNGANVSAGQRIGTTGNTGNSSAPHLHFEIRTGSNGTLRCPQRWLQAVWDGQSPPALTNLPTTGCFF